LFTILRISAKTGTALKLFRIAFIACNKNSHRFMQDPSYIYRCENLALALSALGHQAEMLHYTQLSSKAQYDIVVFHRPTYRFGFAWLVKKLRKNGAVVLADVDDLIFNANWAITSPGVINQLVSIKQTEKNFAANAKALAAFNYLTTSTAPLADKLQKHFPSAQVLLLPNSVHHSWYQYEKLANFGAPKLTYFPGTRSHDRDFATISAPLAEFLHQHPEIELHITGVLNCQLKCRPNQLFFHDKQPFANYVHHVAQSWVNLAPLEDTLFNQHKSALKAIEAGFFNAPTVASPIADMQRLKHCGVIMPNNDSAWFSHLSALTDGNVYQQHSHQLRQRTLACSNIIQQAQRLLAFAGKS
jgi:hypothetical protein